MSRRRLHHGNSSGEEEQEVLLGTRVGSKNFEFSGANTSTRRRSKKSKKKIAKAGFFTIYCTLISFSGAFILTIIGIYMSSNSRFFVLGGPEMEKHRAEKTTHVFLAAALYLCIGVYCSYRWRLGGKPSSVSGLGRIN